MKYNKTEWKSWELKTATDGHHHHRWWCHQRHHARMFPNYASWWMKTPGRGYKTPTKINNNNRGAARSEADVANSPARRPGKVAPIFLAVSLPDRGWLPPPSTSQEKPPSLCAVCPVPSDLSWLFDGSGLGLSSDSFHSFRSPFTFVQYVFFLWPPWLMCLGILKSNVHKFILPKWKQEYFFEPNRFLNLNFYLPPGQLKFLIEI